MNNEQFYFGNFNLKKKKRIKINNNLKKKNVSNCFTIMYNPLLVFPPPTRWFNVEQCGVRHPARWTTVKRRERNGGVILILLKICSFSTFRNI